MTVPIRSTKGRHRRRVIIVLPPAQFWLKKRKPKKVRLFPRGACRFTKRQRTERARAAANARWGK